ncbi:hypothetical protein FAM09_10465 [Niastella caeni]|uniref:DUF4468 domain-containing protein n=1 Tax=Niastella caeni TaxID=2569763 RepID=A0A4S8HY89_9BACT|nr:hypothetical protein [Niastella caeni]THU40281.1 hypothetical protein FAM09_10465 [Niastella caeni]
MKTRLLTLLLTSVVATALAQTPPNTTVKNVVKPVSNTQTATPPPIINFENQKLQIDSLVQVAEAGQYLDHASFRGKAREGKYWVECFYSKGTREILKANYLFTTDSLNFSKTYYFKANSVIKVLDNNTTNYYQIGNVILNEQGTLANPALSKKFNELIVDTFQGLYQGLFP